MLVLSRKKGEEIVVPGANIRIIVLDAKGTRVRLGIRAPADVTVYRKEIWERVCTAMDALAMVDSSSPEVVDGPVRPK
jgi:carbon storage regulator